MNLHLAEISRYVAPRAHAVLMLDGAGCTALTTSSWLGDRIFASYDDIVESCCDTWNRLIDQPWKIMSLGLRSWAYRL